MFLRDPLLLQSEPTASCSLQHQVRLPGVRFEPDGAHQRAQHQQARRGGLQPSVERGRAAL